MQAYRVNTPIETIPTGIDSDHFRRGIRKRFLQEFNIPCDRPILLNVSRIAHEKRIERLLHCVQRLKHTLPDILLIIAGEGPAKSHLKRLSSALDITENIRFVGYLDRNSSLIDCYASADIFVFSSTTETQGLVLLEAMASGTAVVSVAAMGTTDVLKGYSKLAITDGSVDDFTSKISFLLSHPHQLSTLSQHAREYARQWDSHQQARKMIQFYQQILSRSQQLQNGSKYATTY